MIRGRPEKNLKNPRGQCKIMHTAAQDLVLKDYLARKYPEDMQKLTFDEWLQTPVPMDDGSDSEVQFFERSNEEIWLMKQAWEAAQENK